MNHALQHLRRCDDHLTCVIALGDQHLLKDGDLLKRNLDAHIAARDHNAVADAQDVVDVANALGVFDLCNDADFFIALTLQDLTDLEDIIGAAAQTKPR